VGLHSGLRAPADWLTAAARCNRCRPSRGTRRAQQLLAGALVAGAALPIWAQSHPTPALSSQVTNADGPMVTAGGSGMPDFQLDRSEEDWSGLCRHANGRDDFWDHSSASGSGDLSGTSPSAQNYALRMRSTAITTGAADHRIATATTSTD